MEFLIEILIESPKSWTASEIIATLLVKNPPNNSNNEKVRFNKKATKIFLSVFILPPFLYFLISKHLI